MSSNKGDPAVGYGRPPKHSQFRKGESGNPHGRPRASRIEDIDLVTMIDQPVEVLRNGVLQPMSPKEIELRGLFQKVVQKKSVPAMLRLIEQFEAHGVLAVPLAQRGVMIIYPATMPDEFAIFLYHSYGKQPWTPRQIRLAAPRFLATLSDEERRSFEGKGYTDLFGPEAAVA